LKYSLDTSALLEAWVRRYPQDLFPTLWDRLRDAADSGVIGASEEVLREVEKKDDGLHDWLRARAAVVVPTDDRVQRTVREVLAAAPRLMGARSGRNTADPFVIAAAQVHGLTVVTQEGLGSVARPKIPDVCNQLGVSHIDIVEVFRREGWRF